MGILNRKLAWLLAHRHDPRSRALLQTCAEIVLARAPAMDETNLIQTVVASLNAVPNGVAAWHAELVRDANARGVDVAAEHAQLSRVLDGLPEQSLVPASPNRQRLLRRARLATH